MAKPSSEKGNAEEWWLGIGESNSRKEELSWPAGLVRSGLCGLPELKTNPAPSHSPPPFQSILSSPILELETNLTDCLAHWAFSSSVQNNSLFLLATPRGLGK